MVRRRVGRSYVAMLDPHPKNRGRGIDMLREGGMEVEVGIRADEAEVDMGPHLWKDTD